MGRCNEGKFSPAISNLLILFDPEPATAITGQCDCACTLPSAAALVAPRLEPRRRYRSQILATYPLDGEHVAAHLAQARPVALNRSALALAQRFHSPQAPAEVLAGDPEAGRMQAALAQMIACGLLAPADQVQLLPAEAGQPLVAWLHVTDQCNLRCAYCYLPHQAVSMARPVGFKIIDAVFRSAARHPVPQVKLKYAGGEPLLQFQKVVDWQRYALERAGRAGVDLQAVVLSNGTLLNAAHLRQLKALQMGLMISLDGLGPTHDAQRLNAQGGVTSGRVLQSIELALQAGLTPEISITVSRKSAPGLATLVAWLLDRSLPFSLNFYRPNDLATDGLGLTGEGQGTILAGILAAYRVIEDRLPAASLLAALADRANLGVAHRRVCGVGQNYLVFDAQGRIHRCQMQMNDPIADADADDPLAAVRSSIQNFQNPPVEQTQCAACAWRYFCAGGCHWATYRQTGRYDAPSPYCALYQALYPQVVRLEGLRLLRYARRQ